MFSATLLCLSRVYTVYSTVSVFADRNYNISVEAADHGKPVRSAIALIHILLSPPPPLLSTSQPPPPVKEESAAVKPESSQATEPPLPPTADGRLLPTTAKAPTPSQTKTQPASAKQTPPTAPGPAEQPRSQPNRGDNNNGLVSVTPKASVGGTASDNRTYGGVFKKEVYTVQVVENADTPLVVLALGAELVAGAGAGGAATYRIVGSNYGMFHVGETSGDLVLTTSPDREERDTYILRIKVGTPTYSGSR